MPPPASGLHEPMEPLEPVEAAAPQLVSFCFWLPQSGPAIPIGRSTAPGRTWPQQPDPAALSAAITAHLASLGHAETHPLRWAITAVDPLRGLQLEGVALQETIPDEEL